MSEPREQSEVQSPPRERWRPIRVEPVGVLGEILTNPGVGKTIPGPDVDGQQG